MHTNSILFLWQVYLIGINKTGLSIYGDGGGKGLAFSSVVTLSSSSSGGSGSDSLGTRGPAAPALKAAPAVAAAIVARSAESLRSARSSSADSQASSSEQRRRRRNRGHASDASRCFDWLAWSPGLTRTCACSTTTGEGSSGGGSGGPDKAKALSADEALKYFGAKLTPFERVEVHGFGRVYFVGQNAKKRTVGPASANGSVGQQVPLSIPRPLKAARVATQTSNNFGFDDENGSYMLTQQDHVFYRYEVLRVIGKGSFGQVIKAFDHKMQQYVALKLVRE